MSYINEYQNAQNIALCLVSTINKMSIQQRAGLIMIWVHFRGFFNSYEELGLAKNGRLLSGIGKELENFLM